MKLTKKEFELYMNRFGGECPQVDYEGKLIKNYGSWMRNNDSTLFDVSYREWVNESGVTK